MSKKKSEGYQRKLKWLKARFSEGMRIKLLTLWEEKANALGKGLTILRSDQCPYIVDATQISLKSAQKAGIDSRIIELKNREDVLRLSPSPYGVFGLGLNSKLLSYHYLLEKDLLPLLSRHGLGWGV